ncbi:hypothetical protein HCN44_009456 [Aphidius gifuensis]|uniref:Ionotropic receptor n=1 Tax=Aphidius gifuensis TaxID=684658 RepID=A0A835CY31_APHGI|nr:hypothetical protein HCN44_009456 [Aphidius gifuensis]
MYFIKFSTYITVIYFMAINFLADANLTSWNLKNNSKLLENELMNLLKICFVGHSNYLMMLGHDDDFIDKIDKIETASTVIIKNNSNIDTIKNHWQLSSIQLDIIILSIKSSKNLELELSKLKSSPWWSIDSHYFIINTSNTSCDNAIDYLNTTWHMNLLSSIFMCQEENQQINLYTYNPYTNWAPSSWHHQLQINKTWTLYNRPFNINSNNTCSNLIFDKTRYLNGYPIKALANPKKKEKYKTDVNYNYTSLSKISSSDLLRCLFSALNSSLIIHLNGPMYLDNNGKPTSQVFYQLSDGIYDMSLNFRYLRNVKNHRFFDYTYSYTKSSVVIITHKSKQMTPEEKFKRYYSRNVVMLTIISCLLTLFAFGIYEKQGFGIAFFEVLRLIFNTGLLYMPTSTTMRIYLYPIMILFLILSSTFNSKLASYLTHKHYHSNIDNIDDLKSSNHQVFVANEFEHYLKNFPRKYHIYLASDFCSSVLLNNSNAACVGRRDYEAATRFYLHMSKETVADFYETQLMRKNWPLKKKINFIYSILMECGLLPRLRYQQLVTWQKVLAQNEERNSPKYRPVRKKNILFALKLFTVGIILSIISFIVEIFYYKKNNKIKTLKLNNNKYFDFTYPLTKSGLVLTTQRKGYLTPWQKICQFYSQGVIILTLIVCLTSVVFISIYKNQGLSSACLEVFRLCVGTGLLHMPNNTIIRIYLFPVLLLFLLLGLSFNSKLSSFLTNSNPLENIDNIEELENSNYTIYVYEGIKTFILNFKNKNIIYTSNIDCYKFVLNDSSSACITYESRSYDRAMKYKLYIGKIRVLEFYEVFLMRKNLPVGKKIKDIMSRLMESGLLSRWRYKLKFFWNELVEQSNKEIAVDYYRPVTIEDLYFSFKFLAVGLSMSFILFLLEFFHYKKFNLYR